MFFAITRNTNIDNNRAIKLLLLLITLFKHLIAVSLGTLESYRNDWLPDVNA